MPLWSIAPHQGLNSGKRGATPADYAHEDLFFWLTPPAKWRRGAYTPPIDFYCPHSPRTTFVTNRHKAIDGRYSMSTLATRYAVVLQPMPPTMLTHGKHRHCHLSIGLSSLAIVSHTTPNVGGTPLRVLALNIANQVHMHCLGKTDTVSHVHIVDIMHTPRKTPPPNPLKKGRSSNYRLSVTLFFYQTRATLADEALHLGTVTTVPHVAVFQRIHSIRPPNRLRLGYTVPRHLTATASSAGCYSRLQVAQCRVSHRTR